MNTRQKIVDVLESRFKSLAGVRKVSIWKVTDFSPAEHPAILIRDTVDVMPSDGVIGKIDHELTVEISSLFFGQTSAKDAREMVATIMASIGTDKTYGGLAHDTIVNSAELDIDETGKKISAAVIDVTILYRSNLWEI